jgi:hypothetical protein
MRRKLRPIEVESENVKDISGKHVGKIRFDIYKTGVVADLSFSVWGAKTKLGEDDLGLKGIPEDKISLGHKRLIKKNSFNLIYTAYNEAYLFFRRNSFEFPFGSARFVPYPVLQKLVEHETACEIKFYAAVEEFLAEYSVNRFQMLEEYDKVFEDILKQRKISSSNISSQKGALLSRLEEKYPSVDSLRKKFKFEFLIFEVSSPEFKVVDFEDALTKAKKLEDLEKLYKEKVSQKLDVFLEDVVSSLKTKVLEIVEKLSERLEKGSVSMATVKAFQRFAESFKAMDFVDLGVDDAIASLELKLKDVQKNDLDNEKFKEALVQELEKIKTAALAVDDDKVLGRFKRNLRVIE